MSTKTPTRLEYLAVTTAARAINPLLAMDAKIEYGPIFKGLTMANLKARKPTIISDIRRALRGKTIAKDAGIEHFANMLDMIEKSKEPKQLDESVSGPQHRAMEVAAHGESNLGIPKEVGKEFERADKGKTFGDALGELFAKKGIEKDAIDRCMDAIRDEMPENALDEDFEDGEVEETGDEKDPEKEENAEDEGETEEERKKREEKEAEDKARDAARGAKDRRAAKDKGAMDKKVVTVDEMEKAISIAVRNTEKRGRERDEARAFVRPYVGELPLALDSAEAIHRAAAVALGIEDAETVHATALKPLIKMMPQAGARQMQVHDSRTVDDDAGAFEGFASRWPDAAKIQTV